MGRPENKFVAPVPPEPVAPLVLSRLRAVQRELVDLKLLIPERALASAEGKPGARESLAELGRKISEAEFEISCHSAARGLGEWLHEQSMAEWKAEVQTLEPADIIAGISKEQCCRRCIPGVCAITGSDPYAGPCAHPVLVGHLELQRYVDNPRIAEIYAAACAKLGLRSHAA